MGLDAQWYLAVNHFAKATPWLHEAMRLLAVYGVFVFVPLVVVAWLGSRGCAGVVRALSALVWAALGALAALGINQVIVGWVKEPRPFISFPHSEVLVARAHDFSFPSDHAVACGAAVAGLWIACSYVKRIRWVAIVVSVLAVLVCFSRVYVGVHYPEDVVAGYCVGGVVVLVGWALVGRVLSWLVGKICELKGLRWTVGALRILEAPSEVNGGSSDS